MGVASNYSSHQSSEYIIEHGSFVCCQTCYTCTADNVYMNPQSPTTVLPHAEIINIKNISIQSMLIK